MHHLAPDPEIQIRRHNGETVRFPTLTAATVATIASYSLAKPFHIWKLSYISEDGGVRRFVVHPYADLLKFPAGRIAKIESLSPEFAALRRHPTIRHAASAETLFFLEVPVEDGEMKDVYSVARFRATLTPSLYRDGDVKKTSDAAHTGVSADAFVETADLPMMFKYIGELRDTYTGDISVSMARLADRAQNPELRKWLNTYAMYTFTSTRYLKPCLCMNRFPTHALNKKGVSSTPIVQL